MKNLCLLVYCILSFERASYNRLQGYFLLFYIASESADTIFNIYWKKIFVMNFHFLMNSAKPIPILLRMTNVFADAP